MGDMGKRLGDQWRVAGDFRGGEQACMGAGGADPQGRVGEGDAGQFGQPADIDQQRRRREPEIQCRQQALAAGDQFGSEGVACEPGDRLGDRPGSDVIKGGGFHAWLPAGSDRRLSIASLGAAARGRRRCREPG